MESFQCQVAFIFVLIQNSTRLTCGKIKTFLILDLAKGLDLIC